MWNGIKLWIFVPDYSFSSSPLQLGMTNRCFCYTKKRCWNGFYTKKTVVFRMIICKRRPLQIIICKRLQPWKGHETTLIQGMLAHLKMNAWMTEGVVNQMQSCWSVASPASDIYSRLFYTLAYHICTSCILNVSICMSIYLSVWFRCI